MAKAQKDLPGMEDREIAGLEAAASEYADVRDERMKWGAKEVELKTKILDLMKQHKKKTYRHAGVEIEVVTEKEKVKVRVRGQEEESEEEAA